MGDNKTLEKVISRFYWKLDISGDIKVCVQKCDKWQRNNDTFRKPSAVYCILHKSILKSGKRLQVLLHTLHHLTACMHNLVNCS